MTNLFIQEPIYITIADLKDSTSKDGIVALVDEDLKVLITKAQTAIDNYIVRYGIKFDENQTNIFPVNEEDISVIPNEITIATIYVVEQLFMNGDLIVSATNSGGDIKQEKVGDRTIAYTEGTISSNGAELAGIPREAKILLDRYRKVFYNVSL